MYRCFRLANELPRIGDAYFAMSNEYAGYASGQVSYSGVVPEILYRVSGAVAEKWRHRSAANSIGSSRDTLCTGNC